MDRVGSKEEEESAMLPFVAGLPSDWSGLLRLKKNDTEWFKLFEGTETCFLPYGARYLRYHLFVQVHSFKEICSE